MAEYVTSHRLKKAARRRAALIDRICAGFDCTPARPADYAITTADLLLSRDGVLDGDMPWLDRSGLTVRVPTPPSLEGAPVYLLGAIALFVAGGHESWISADGQWVHCQLEIGDSRDRAALRMDGSAAKASGDTDDAQAVALCCCGIVTAWRRRGAEFNERWARLRAYHALDPEAPVFDEVVLADLVRMVAKELGIDPDSWLPDSPVPLDILGEKMSAASERWWPDRVPESPRRNLAHFFEDVGAFAVLCRRAPTALSLGRRCFLGPQLLSAAVALRDDCHLVLIGREGTGKTTCAKEAIRDAFPAAEITERDLEALSSVEDLESLLRVTAPVVWLTCRGRVPEALRLRLQKYLACVLEPDTPGPRIVLEVTSTVGSSGSDTLAERIGLTLALRRVASLEFRLPELETLRYLVAPCCPGEPEILEAIVRVTKELESAIVDGATSVLASVPAVQAWATRTFAFLREGCSPVTALAHGLHCVLNIDAAGAPASVQHLLDMAEAILRQAIFDSKPGHPLQEFTIAYGHECRTAWLDFQGLRMEVDHMTRPISSCPLVFDATASHGFGDDTMIALLPDDGGVTLIPAHCGPLDGNMTFLCTVAMAASGRAQAAVGWVPSEAVLFDAHESDPESPRGRRLRKLLAILDQCRAERALEDGRRPAILAAARDAFMREMTPPRSRIDRESSSWDLAIHALLWEVYAPWAHPEERCRTRDEQLRGLTISQKDLWRSLAELAERVSAVHLDVAAITSIVLEAERVIEADDFLSSI